MTRKLSITHIASSYEECESLAQRTIDALKNVSKEIVAIKGEIYHIPPFNQYRCPLVFSKVKGITWDQYYKTINTVKAVHYTLI